jgi:hypothetical protein
MSPLTQKPKRSSNSKTTTKKGPATTTNSWRRTPMLLLHPSLAFFPNRLLKPIDTLIIMW